MIELLRRPIVTERTTALKEQNKYVFAVLPSATKGQIREAVEAAFKVDVVAVNTAVMPGKMRRRAGPRGGYRPDWKKAIITIRPGQEIKLPESAA